MNQVEAINEDFSSYSDALSMMKSVYGRSELLSKEKKEELSEKILYTTNLEVLEREILKRFKIKIKFIASETEYFEFSDNDINQEITRVKDTFIDLINIKQERLEKETDNEKIREFIDKYIIGKKILKDFRRNAAINTFINGNLRLVLKIAYGYSRAVGRSISMEDIINQGTIGLHEAVLRFDYKKGFEFSTYANWWINQSINRYVKDNNRTIRVPLHAIDKLQLVLNIKKKLIQNGEKVTISSIASRLDLTKSEVSDILNIPYATESVVSSGDKDDDVFDLVENYSTQEGSLSDQEVLLDKKIFSFDSKLFEEVLDGLTEREKEIIIKRYKFDLSLEEVGDTLYDPISIERVRQIQLKAERKIRRNIEKLDLDQYV